MNAIKTARKLIERNPDSQEARTLAQMVLALESDVQLEVASLYDLKLDTFELAIKVLQEWRLARYYAGKAKLFDLASQLNELPHAVNNP